MLPTKIQLFAEDEATNTDTATAVVTRVDKSDVTAGTTQASAIGKTYSEEYVHDLREEAKSYRQTARNNEKALRKALGLGDEDVIGDVDKRISDIQAENAKRINDALSTANKRLINAEIKALEGYDTKLLTRVMDMTKISVDDAGNVQGLTEAVEEAEKEYPQVKTQTAHYSTSTGSNPIGSKYSKEMYAFRKSAGLSVD